MSTSVEQLHAEVYPAVEIVQAELDLMRAEKELADYWTHRSHIVKLAKEVAQEERITRRRLVRDLTRKQMALGERILRDLAARKANPPG